MTEHCTDPNCRCDVLNAAMLNAHKSLQGLNGHEALHILACVTAVILEAACEDGEVVDVLEDHMNDIFNGIANAKKQRATRNIAPAHGVLQ